jgi:hypothetical protein
VPPDFNRYADIPEKDVIARLDQWKEQAVRTLQELQTRIQQERASLSLKQQADVVSATSVFDADATWVTSESRVLSRGMFFIHSKFMPFEHRVRYFTGIFGAPVASCRADTSAQRETAVSIQPTSVDKPRDWTQTGTACWRSNGLAGLLRQPDVEGLSWRVEYRAVVCSEYSSNFLLHVDATS